MSQGDKNTCTERSRSIPEGWVETTIGSISKVKGGKRLPKGETLIQNKNSHPYIRITDFQGNSINKNQLQFVPNKTFEKISRYIVNENDVIISIVGTIGLVAKIDKDLNNASLTENCVKLIDLKKVDSDYLFFYLTSRIGQSEINKNTVGAVQKKLPIYGIQSINITLPSLQEQKAIAKVLTAFDDKIENLRAQNTTLEQTAQTIFNEWFGKYQLEDELPEGWRTCKLEEIATISAGGDKPKNSTKERTTTNTIPIYSNGISDDGLYGYTDKPKIKEESITVSARGTIGFVCLRFQPYVPIVRLISVIPNSKYLSSKYLFYWLNNQDIIGFGTTQQQLTVPVFKNTEIIIPSLDSMMKFTTLVNSFYEKINLNKRQIQSLSQTRDTLLPKLMSGQLRVKEV